MASKSTGEVITNTDRYICTYIHIYNRGPLRPNITGPAGWDEIPTGGARVANAIRAREKKSSKQKSDRTGREIQCYARKCASQTNSQRMNRTEVSHLEIKE